MRTLKLRAIVSGERARLACRRRRPRRRELFHRAISAGRISARRRNQHARAHALPELSIVIALFVLSAVSLFAAEVIPPKPAGYFNDYAGVVPKETALQLNEKLAQFERETSNQIVVAVFPKMETDSSVEDYAQRIAQSWDIGQKETSKRQRCCSCWFSLTIAKYPFRSDTALEGALPDAICFDITHNAI